MDGLQLLVCGVVLVSIILQEAALEMLYSPNGVTISEEKNLCRLLMANYTDVGINGRPVVNISQAITVYFGLGLIQMGLDEKNKLLATSVWARYMWKDEYLQWHPNEHGGVTNIKLPISSVWKPDIMLYNTAETEVSARDVLAVVQFDGSVMWLPHQIFKSSCSVDVTNFPFDQQICLMHFGSWTYGLKDLDLRLAFPAGIDLSTFMSDYKDSCAWDIYNSTAAREVQPPDNPALVSLSFTLLMRRKMVFSSYILTLPCIFLAVLTLVVFWLPPDRPDRTSLAMAIFASFLVLLLILVEAAPPTASSVPTLGVYYIFNMVIITMSIFFSTMVINILRGGDFSHRVPKCVKFVLIDCLGCILCIRPFSQFKSAKAPNHQATASQDIFPIEEATKLLQGQQQGNQSSPAANPSITYDFNGVTTGSGENACSNCSTSCSFRSDIQQMKTTISQIAGVFNKVTARNDAKRFINKEWQALAKVMDRLLFLLYFVAIAFSLFVLFPRPEGFTFL